MSRTATVEEQLGRRRRDFQRMFARSAPELSVHATRAIRRVSNSMVEDALLTRTVMSVVIDSMAEQVDAGARFQLLEAYFALACRKVVSQLLAGVQRPVLDPVADLASTVQRLTGLARLDPGQTEALWTAFGRLQSAAPVTAVPAQTTAGRDAWSRAEEALGEVAGWTSTQLVIVQQYRRTVEGPAGRARVATAQLRGLGVSGPAGARERARRRLEEATQDAVQSLSLLAGQVGLPVDQVHEQLRTAHRALVRLLIGED